MNLSTPRVRWNLSRLAQSLRADRRVRDGWDRKGVTAPGSAPPWLLVEVNLATQCSSTIGSSCQKARPCDRSNASIAAPVDGFAWLIIAGSQSAAATSPDRNFRSSASASATPCALLSPSPSLVFQCLQGDVSCGHNVVTTLTSKGHRQIDARKYSPSGAVGLRPAYVQAHVIDPWSSWRRLAPAAIGVAVGPM
jgi:hypothetical protein